MLVCSLKELCQRAPFQPSSSTAKHFMGSGYVSQFHFICSLFLSDQMYFSSRVYKVPCYQREPDHLLKSLPSDAEALLTGTANDPTAYIIYCMVWTLSALRLRQVFTMPRLRWLAHSISSPSYLLSLSPLLKHLFPS